MADEFLRRRFLALPLLASILCACSTAPKWPWDGGKGVCKGDTCHMSDAHTAFAVASQYCRDMQAFYENTQNYSKEAGLGVGLLGTISGTIAAPLSTGNAAKGFAAVSGAANAYQSRIEQTINSVVMAKQGQAIHKAFSDAQTNFSGTKTPDDLVHAALAMATECSLAPATALVESIQNISLPAGSTTPLKPPNVDKAN